MKFSHVVSGAFCFCFISGSVAAQENKDFKKFYVGAEYGSTEHKYSHEDYSGDYHDKDKMNGFYVGYRFNEAFSLKLGYIDQGSTELDSEDQVITVDDGFGGAVTVYATGELKSDVDGTYLGVLYGGEISNGFGVGFEIGIWKYTTDVYVDVEGYVPTYDQSFSESKTLDKKDGVGVYLGMSATYDFNDVFGMEIGVKRYVAENDFVDGSDVYLTNIYVGARVSF
jgi:hypothetical protein